MDTSTMRSILVGIILIALSLPIGAEEKEDIKRAQKLFSQGKPRAAIALLEKVIQADPDQIKAHKLLGEAYLLGGSPRLAEPHLKKVVEKWPQDASAWNTYAGCALRRGKAKLAEERFLKAIKAKKSYLRAYRNLSELYMTLNQPKKSLAVIEKAVRHRPYDVLLKIHLAKMLGQVGQLKRADKVLVGAAKLAPSNDEIHALRGVFFLRRSMYDAALIVFYKAIKKNPRRAGNHEGMGMALLYKGYYDKAEMAFRDTYKLKPQAEVALKLVVALQHQKKYKEGVEWCRKVLKKDPKNQSAQFALAVLYTNLGEIDRAGRIYLKLLEKNPKNLEARNNLGLLYLIKKKHKKALASFDEILKQSPDQPGVKINRARTLLAMGREKEGRKILAEVVKNSSSPDMNSLQAFTILMTITKKSKSSKKEK